jgi:hypothetical protein
MRPHFRLSFPALASLSLVAAVAACSGRDNLIQPPVLSPLAGLAESAARDSSGNAPPTGNFAPGDIRGTVVGPSPVGSTGDTLAAAPRVAGVEVTAYPVTGTSGPLPDVGPAIATTVTDANGRFSLPSLPGGPIVVTFEPPSSSPYAGTWSSTVITAQSDRWPWWVVLPTK